MQNRPKTWEFSALLEADLGETTVLASSSIADRILESLPFSMVASLDELPEDPDTLIVIGGGTLMDEAKAWRARQCPATRLVAIPSLWGSGAEVSPVAVLNRQGKKKILVGDEMIPDILCLWPELATSIPESVARHACGDAWSHALEGFLSPLADAEVKDELAAVMKLMLELPVGNDPGWFELSARACAGQARSGVGLVHGIAHTLEGDLREQFPDAGWGHAKLCSVYLLPVIEFNRQNSPKWQRLIPNNDLDGPAILEILEQLYEPESYLQSLSLLQQRWMEILRDPCSRINSALVRPDSKTYFAEYAQ